MGHMVVLFVVSGGSPPHFLIYIPTKSTWPAPEFCSSLLVTVVIGCPICGVQCDPSLLSCLEGERDSSRGLYVAVRCSFNGTGFQRSRR